MNHTLSLPFLPTCYKGPTIDLGPHGRKHEGAVTVYGHNVQLCPRKELHKWSLWVNVLLKHPSRRLMLQVPAGPSPCWSPYVYLFVCEQAAVQLHPKS